MKEYINGYALALVSISKEKKQTDLFKKDIIEMIDILETNNDYFSLLKTFKLSKEERKKILSETFSSQVDVIIMNLMFVLIDRSKIQYIIKIFKKFIKIVNQENNIHEGIVYTNTKIDKTKIKQFENKISKLLNQKVYLINKIDKTIISGFKVIVDDKIIEDTISSRLENLKYELLKEEIPHVNKR